MRERKKESKMLWIKCLAGALIMLAVHFISKSPVYFISAIMLSFSGLSMIAYYFMYQEHGAGQVMGTVKFAMFSQIPFFCFLLSLYLLLKKHTIGPSLCGAFFIWLMAAGILVFLWKH